MAATEKLTLELIADIARLDKGLNAGAGKVSAWSRNVPNLLGAAVKGFAVLGAATAAVGAGIVAITTKIATAGDSLAKMSKRTGMSIKFLSEMKHVLDLNDASLESLGIAARGMARALLQADEESKQSVEAMEALGLRLDDLKKMKPDEMFMAVMRALSKVENATMRAAYAQRILGRGGEALLPTVLDLADGLAKAQAEAQRFAQVWTDAEAKDAEEYADAITRVKASVSGLAMSFAKQLLPVGAEIFNHLAEYLVRFQPLARAAGASVRNAATRAFDIFKANEDRIARIITRLFAIASESIRWTIRLLQWLTASVGEMVKVTMPLLTAIGHQVTRLFSAIRPQLEWIRAWIKAHPAEMAEVVRTLAAAAAAVITFRSALVALAFVMRGVGLMLSKWVVIPAAIGAALYTLYRHSEKVRAFVEAMRERLEALYGVVSEKVRALVEAITPKLKALWEAVEKAFGAMTAALNNFGDALAGWAGAAWDFGAELFTMLVDAMREAVELLTGALEDLAAWWHTSGLDGVMATLMVEIKRAIGLVRDDLPAALEKLQEVLGRIGAAIKGFFGEEIAKFSAWWRQDGPVIVQWLNEVIEGLGVLWEELLYPIIKTHLKMLLALLESLVGVLKVVGSFVLELFRNLVTIIASLTQEGQGERIIESVKNIVLAVLAVIPKLLIAALGPLIAEVADVLGVDLAAAWEQFRNGLISRVLGLKDALMGAVREVWNAAESWMEGKINAFVEKLQAVWERVKKLFDFSTKGSPSMYDVFQTGLDNVTAMFEHTGAQLGSALRHAAAPGIEAIVPASATSAAAAPVAGTAAQLAPNISLTLNVHGGMVDQKFLYEQLGPAIERMVRQGYMKLRQRP